MPGSKKANVSIAVASSVITGYAPVVSIAVKTVTEAIATKHGTALTAVIAWIMRMTNVMSVVNA